LEGTSVLSSLIFSCADSLLYEMYRWWWLPCSGCQKCIVFWKLVCCLTCCFNAYWVETFNEQIFKILHLQSEVCINEWIYILLINQLLILSEVMHHLWYIIVNYIMVFKDAHKKGEKENEKDKVKNEKDKIKSLDGANNKLR